GAPRPQAGRYAGAGRPGRAAAPEPPLAYPPRAPVPRAADSARERLRRRRIPEAGARRRARGRGGEIDPRRRAAPLPPLALPPADRGPRGRRRGAPPVVGQLLPLPLGLHLPRRAEAGGLRRSPSRAARRSAPAHRGTPSRRRSVEALREGARGYVPCLDRAR